MGLVLTIALGIVVAVLILNFLPLLLSAGVIGILIVAGLALGALALSLWLDSPIMMGLCSLAIVAYLIIEHRMPAIRRNQEIRRLEKLIDEREGLGYDASDLKVSLEKLDAARNAEKKAQAVSKYPKLPWKLRVFGTAADQLRARRKSLGYDE